MALSQKGAFLDRSLRPPCQVACPINQDVRGYVKLIAWGEPAEALGVIRETNPLPAICGTICARPCEGKCRRGRVDEPLSIRALKRFAVEHGGEVPSPAKGGGGPRIAIVGSGPAGLTAAHDLALLGYSVTVLEREEALGGVLRMAVPLYRLPREVMDRDIAAIAALGVEIETRRGLGENLTLEDLKKQGYQAILLSVGLPLSRPLEIPGRDLEGVSLALPFLRVANSERKRTVEGREVIVIGGGNVAVDVARCALRLGARSVRMVCLEAEEEMPAFPEEIEEAGEEGIETFCSRGPRRVLSQGDRITGLECVRCEAVFDSQGRFNPTFCEEETSVIPGDAVIIAIGQAADLSFALGSKLEVNERGRLLFDPDTLATGEEGVFVAGEIASGPGTAVEAMASGRKAALSIHRYLGGKTLAPRPPDQVGELEEATIQKIKGFAREKVPTLALEVRRDNFDQIDLGYGESLAVREARRCLLCGAGAEVLKGKCSACLACVRACPYGVPIVTPTGGVEIRPAQCQACGICLAECPARAITFRWQPEDEVLKRLEAAVAEASLGGPVLIGFCCSYGPYALRNFTQFLRKRPSNLGMVRLPCITMIDLSHLLRAFELGAAGVFVAGCLEEDCPYQKSAFWAKRRVEAGKKILAEMGLGPERLEFHTLSASEVERFEEFVTQIGERLKKLSVPA